VPSSTDSVAGGAEQEQDGADHDDDDPKGPQNWYVEDKSEYQ
jgi:hypothetical protein